ncbi:MAG TPA: GNAT family N-acetyltransferase [Candidatus Angelobacter sp.]|nr:GNAT family N-acetyltransferase [Candidatus Angelobacter sp.]
MNIRQANLEDAEEMTRVEIQSKAQSIPELVSPIEIDFVRRLERWRTYLRGESFPQMAKAERVAFKACIGPRMIGYIAGHLTARYGKDSEIESFYILQDHQRKGTGRKLLQRFVEWAQQHEARSLCVGIAARNPYQAFYLKYGGKHLNPHWIYWDDLAALWERTGERNKPWGDPR